MADLSDVAQVLADLVLSAVYPNGAIIPFVGVGTKPGACIKIFQGWPIPAQLDADIAAGIPEISVYPLKGKDTTRYLTDFHVTSKNTPTLTLTASGLNVTVGGTVPPASNPTNVVIFVNGTPYVYQAQVSDSIQTIAIALAALIATAVPLTYAIGNVITLPVGARLGAVRVGITGQISNIAESELRRFQITIWANSNATRSVLGKAIRQYFAPISRIELPDGSQGNITFVDDFVSDAYQKQALYRRDIWYTVDYPTLQTLTATQITQIETTFARSDTSPPQPISTTYS